MRHLLTLLTLFTTLGVQALDCEILLVTEDEFLEMNIEAPMEAAGHGAPEYELKGDSNIVTAMADGQWLGIRWTKKGEVVAETLTVLKTPVNQPRTLLVYNPKNTDEQASISCQE